MESDGSSEIRKPLVENDEMLQLDDCENTEFLNEDSADEEVRGDIPHDICLVAESSALKSRPRRCAEDNRGDIGIESLDYDPVQSFVSAKTKKVHTHRHLYGYTGLTLAKWTITIATGLLVGFVAYVISSIQELVITCKKTWTQSLLTSSLGIAFMGYAAFGILLVLISSCLVLYWAPAAAGGGVTLVMAYLNGNDIPNLLRFQTLITKTVGSICTITSGLPLGQEGPMVHIGAAIASSLTWMHGRFPGKNSFNQRHSCFDKLNPQAWPFDIHNDKDRREFISAGTAAGLAAAFGAPIGGVLYSLEEASSFWSRKVMWRSLVCTTVATMLLSWLHDKEFSFALPGSLAFHGLQPVFQIEDLPLFVITSAAAGILGALVNTSHGWLSHMRPPSSHAKSRIFEACCVTFISVAVIFLLPLFYGKCLPVSDLHAEKEFWFSYSCSRQDQDTGLRQYNDLATLLFSVPHETIRHLLQLGKHADTYFTMMSLAIHTFSFLGVFVLAYGIATPGGIFMPSMMVGASFGALLGCLFQYLLPRAEIQPGLHALIGATALLGGVFRSSISVVVIMVEGTGGIDFILPIIMAVVVSNWVAHHIHQHGAYEADLEQSGNVHFLQSEPPRELAALTACDIMSPEVVDFEEVASVHEVVQVLKSTMHNGFPVFRSAKIDSNASNGKMVGLILRHQLLLLLEQHAFVEVDLNSLKDSNMRSYPFFGHITTKQLKFLEQAMLTYHFCHYPHRRDLTSRPEAVNELDLRDVLSLVANPNDLNCRKTLVIDLRPFMNRAPLTVKRECSAKRVYVIFRTLGLRHLCVTDSNSRVVGMITRKDLSLARKGPTVHQFGGSTVLLKWESENSLDERTARDILYSLP